MENTVFIFGAGASHGVIGGHTYPRYEYRDTWRPPLANDLMKSSREFDGLIHPLNELNALAGEIRGSLSGNNSLEEFMLELKEKAKKSRIRQIQLMQLRFYLRHLLHECSRNYVFTGNLYAALAARMLDIANGAEITFISFNYDTLIEEALQNLRLLPNKIKNLNAYTQGTIKLFKPHGSVNWIYRLKGGSDLSIGPLQWLISNYQLQEPDVTHIPIEIEEAWDTSKLISNYLDPWIHYPAIAIPLSEKSEFCFPQAHLDAMKAALGRAKHIVGIGWRGQENHFGEILANECPKSRPIFHIVDTSIKNADEIGNHLILKYVNNGRNRSYGSGFEGFMQSHDTDRLSKIFSEK